MERPLLIFTGEDVVLALTLLIAIGLGLALRHRRPAGRADSSAADDKEIAWPEDALTPAYDRLRALEAVEARTLRAIAEHRARIAAMRQQLLDGTAEEHDLLDAVQRLTFAAIAAQHDRALNEALATEGVDE